MATFPVFNPPNERRDSTTSTSSVPAKRVKDMTPEERLASLQEWAEEQKYFQPGQGGTFGYGGVGATHSVVYSGPVRHVEPAYDGWIAPPSYETVQAINAKDEPSRLKKWLTKRRASKSDNRRSSDARPA